MMNDRELLEMAAKAAGEVFDGWALKSRNSIPWNPRADDGDALRLAVKLNLLVMPYVNDNAVRVVDSNLFRKTPESIVSFGIPPNPYAATRLAIVRAAASIGAAMQQTKGMK